jgi:hypothetical protein
MTPGRRSLRYSNVDEILSDVDRLLNGHTTAGNWSLAQICRHLATVMRRSVDLPASTPYDASVWSGAEQKRRFFESGSFPEGIPTSAQLSPVESLNPREEAEELRQTIAYYKASAGPVIPHVLLGFLTREEWDQFHCIHAAHHFSFVIPTAKSR